LHFCNGDMNNRAWVHPESTEPTVRLIQAVMNELPADRRLDAIHFAIAAGRTPPPLIPEFYTALGGLREVAGKTRLVPGLVHGSQRFEDQVRVLEMIEQNIGARVGAVALACGAGRRGSPELFSLLLERTTRLAVA
jgi:hypothetical protein